jgi:transposase
MLVARDFLPYDLDQQYLLPPSLKEWLPADHLVFFVSDVVDSLDLSAIMGEYRKDELRGRPGYHPAMLTKLLIYGYAQGKTSSRKLERATHEEVPYRVLSGNQHPDHDSIASFRRRHLAALAGLFTQVLRLCQEAGLVKLGHVALDGSKIKANASKHKAMSYARLCRSEEELRHEVERLLAEAEREDQKEDRLYGSARGDELPKELALRESRLKKIREAKAALEEEARRAAEEEAHRQKERTTQREKKEAARGRRFGGRPPRIPDPTQATPEPAKQKNFTDPESCLMKDGATGGYVQAYNAHLAVDEESQVIVACTLSAQPSDAVGFLPLLAETEAQLGRLPKKVSADTGFYSRANVLAAEARPLDCYIPPPRPARDSLSEKMREKLKEPAGADLYRRRKAVVEPVFGQIKEARGFRQVSFRGLSAVREEWRLICLTHNLLKLFRAGVTPKPTPQGKAGDTTRAPSPLSRPFTLVSTCSG